MNNTRLKRCDLGRSRKSRHRERADRVLLECGVSEYTARWEPEDNGGAGRTAMTAPADTVASRGANGRMVQMHLWDQPVRSPVPTATVFAAVPPAVEAPRGPNAPQTVTVGTRVTLPTSPGPKPGPKNRFTLRGFLKGCSIGLATAAALLLIYRLIG
ncbi:MAG: hypothetical protein V2A79_08720 [Planctomycetota bacterium]